MVTVGCDLIETDSSGANCVAIMVYGIRPDRESLRRGLVPVYFFRAILGLDAPRRRCCVFADDQRWGGRWRRLSVLPTGDAGGGAPPGGGFSEEGGLRATGREATLVWWSAGGGRWR